VSRGGAAVLALSTLPACSTSRLDSSFASPGSGLGELRPATIKRWHARAGSRRAAELVRPSRRRQRARSADGQPGLIPSCRDTRECGWARWLNTGSATLKPCSCGDLEDSLDLNGHAVVKLL